MEFVNEFDVNLGNKSIGTNVSQSNRNRSSKSLSDEGINENEVNEEVIIRDPTIRPSTCQLADKYRCDQMILEHNNGPIDYEQIQLPVPTTKKYRTGQFSFLLFFFNFSFHFFRRRFNHSCN